MMTLKSKIAKTLREWADKLDPLIPFYSAHAPFLEPTTHEIQRIMIKHSISRYLYEQSPNRCYQLASEEIVMGIAKELKKKRLIQIVIDPTIETVNFIGKLQVIKLQ